MHLRLLNKNGMVVQEHMLTQSSYEIGNDHRRSNDSNYIFVNSAASRVRHARLQKSETPELWKLVSVSDGISRVGSVKLSMGETILLGSGREFRLGDIFFQLIGFDSDADHRAGEHNQKPSGPSLDEVEAMLNMRLVTFQDENRDLFGEAADHQGILAKQLELFIEEKLEELPITQLEVFCGEAIKRILISACLLSKKAHENASDVQKHFSAIISDNAEDLHKIQSQLVDRMHLGMEDVTTAKDLAKINTHFGDSFKSIAAQISRVLMLEIVRDTIRERVLGLFFRLGPLQFLLDIDVISEIMICAHDKIFVEKTTPKGAIVIETGVQFSSNEELHNIVRRIATMDDKQLTMGEPLVDAKLLDSKNRLSRVNIAIPPIAKKGVALTIRKFPEKKITADQLVQKGSMNDAMLAFLKACVRAKKNVIVSGGTGTGKTTLLNVLSSFIESDRVVTIEDTAELQLNVSNLVSLEARRATSDGTGEVTIKDLLKNALRMRPDRIIVGECRGGETLDMLQAMNTGHDGSMTTAHANTPEDLLLRLETMVLQGGRDIPLVAVRQQIAAAIDLVVQIERVGGKRFISQIAEVSGFDHISGEVEVYPIFEYIQSGQDGRFDISGYAPSFFDEFRQDNLLSEAKFLSVH